MIRFSAFLVVVAVGLLVAGVVTSKLLLVYIAIGVSGVALLALGVGAAVNWRELTGKPGTAQLSLGRRAWDAGTQRAGARPAGRGPRVRYVTRRRVATSGGHRVRLARHRPFSPVRPVPDRPPARQRAAVG